MAAAEPRVVIVGAGFGGLWAAQALAGGPCRVLLIDKNNFHTFLPLLYQVAAAELEPERIAQSVRSLIREHRNVDFLMGEVTGIDLAGRTVLLGERRESYDYLILSMGSTTSYFGVTGAADHSFPLKSVVEGVTLRNQILSSVEAAAQTDDPAARQRLLTFVIVGGGPTGVEFAGALAELLYHPLDKDFPALSLRKEARVILVEAADALLSGIGAGEYARHRLEKIGVDVRLQAAVSAVGVDGVVLLGGERIPTETAVWTAGVRGVPLAEKIGLETGRGGRIPVRETLQTAGHESVFVIGDLAYFEQDGRPLPGVAQVAMQQGRQAAANILAHAAGRSPAPFRYRDKGAMATIGRNAAVANVGGRIYTGFVAWLLWLAVHILFLIGFRNRLGVLVNWAWNYIFYDRVVRLILPALERESGATPISAAGREKSR